jgi:hypothetical protein
MCIYVLVMVTLDVSVTAHTSRTKDRQTI